MSLDEAGFKRYAQEQLRQATPQRMPGVIRKELAQIQKRRELRAAIDEIKANNLPIHYRVCDFTQAASVQALCNEFGDALKMVVHNAGVDRPIRLSGKSLESFMDTVRTKVLGFAHLCTAVAGKSDLIQFCNVGSLTGRMGGMTGETDYAAANEALARLGLWAQKNALSCSVKTLVWPTWEGVGMITNFDVTKRYVTPMALNDGVRHWLREMADLGNGEIMFIGAVGRALTPIQIKGINPIDLPNITQLITLRHHAGNTRQFKPFSRFATCYRIDPQDAPFLDAFQFDGRPAYPASMLLDHACILAQWVNPEDFRPLVLASIVNIKIDLDALVLPLPINGAYEIESRAVGYWLGSDWQVDVHCTDPVTRRELLRLTVIRNDRCANLPALMAPWPQPNTMAALELPALQRPFWNSSLLRGAEWRMVMEGPAKGTRIGQAPVSETADLWALPHPPALQLPVNHIENALRAAWPGSEEAISHLNIEHIFFGPASAASAQFIVQHPDGHVSITDATGIPVIVLHGLSLQAMTRTVLKTPEAISAAAVEINTSFTSIHSSHG
jgi:KR domain